MLNYILLIPIWAAFLVTLFSLPAWIRRAKKAGLVGRDINKFKKIEVAEAGGVTVLAGFILGILLYVAIKTFYFDSNENVIEIFALTLSLLIISFIGLIDDLLGWKIGLSKKVRLFLVLLGAVPLMVINAGEAFATLPFLGKIDLSFWYTLIVIPLGIVGASTTFNFLAGYNGLEARQGILILTGLAVATWFTGSSWLTMILIIMVFTLISFLFFNWYPAKVFPGNVTTYSIGALIAATAVLGNIEKFALFIFIPNFIEIILKLRGKLAVESFGKPSKDGSLELRQNKICGLEHVAIILLKKIKGRAYENDVVLLINAFQIIVIIAGFIIFRQGIF